MSIDKELYTRIVDENRDTCLTIAMEECAELIQAISKAKRGKLDRDNLIEELADVMNVLDWIIYICDINCAEIKEMIEFKQNRCISRFLKGEFK